MNTSTDSTQFRNMTCLWLVAAVLAGIGLAVMMAPWIFSKAPNDLRRTSVLLEALQDKTLQPKFVVLGNSIVMSGIDTQTIGAHLPGKPLGFNLATTGQNPVDSYLYYQNLPASVDTIIQFTLPGFATITDSIEPQKFNAMYMYGYRPNAETQSGLKDLFGTEVGEIFAVSDLGHRFQSRWAIQQTADNIARSMLRTDLNFDSYTFDLYFPNNGADRLADAQIGKALSRRFVRGFDPGYAAIPEKTAFYKAVGRHASQLGKNFALVIAPLHPSVHDRYGDGWYDEVRSYFLNIGKEGGFAVIDATDSIAAEDYVDARHLSKSGGAVLSEFIAAEMQRLDLAPPSR